ncbi:FAD-dependent oxidoreductase [Lichenifustis flavocetrariae]|uniref:FAD-dependent oxidoreductase n=1 Tax=Lichenifustis flavocetrariae TaxID=2949735 RepID=A0AA42CLP2_9HYPH|nr:FAD-dependent oxidoreductase [Lichenifustis flavocetrariae]MCW6510636.1 FAD-dependent oxidoreductase [Lichenifustis flavocetrariae]
MTAPPTDPDLCVIGASEAGRAAAIGAIALGLTVTMVDDGDPSGMDNPDLLIEVLRRATEYRDGLSSGAPIDQAEVWRRVERTLARAAAERSHARLAAMNIRIVRGSAKFADATSITAAGMTIRARRIFIASGSLVSQRAEAPPELPGSLTMDSLRRMPCLPHHLLILGGDHEAVSVAQALSGLGSQVTVLADPLLPDFDPELTAPLLAQLVRRGIRLVEGPLSRIRQAEDEVAVEMTDGNVVTGSHILRLDRSLPDITAYAPDRAGISHGNGTPLLNHTLRTTNSRVYAVGLAAGAKSAAMARAQAAVALRAAFLRQPARMRPETLATVTATEPRIATIGLSDKEAAARGPITVWRWPFAETGAGMAGDRTAVGHLKVVADRRGRILGVGMVGDGVAESIPFWSLAVAQGLDLADLADVALPSPSWSDASRAIALSHAAGRLRNPWVKRALRILRWLG